MKLGFSAIDFAETDWIFESSDLLHCHFTLFIHEGAKSKFETKVFGTLSPFRSLCFSILITLSECPK